MKDYLIAIGEAILFSLAAGLGAALAEELVEHVRHKRKPKKRKRTTKRKKR